jgi:phosphopantothenoylcysteine decarboxylase/phosphopantothenate--cysteine ligase
MGKKIVLGVSGSIAAYKAADLASQLVKAGHDVYPIMTPTASRFLGPATLTALCGNTCCVDLFDEPFHGEITHIHLAKIADLFAIVPASMDLMARLANGLGNDMLTAATLATKAPVVLAPGMNTNMWSHPATQANLERLASYGYQFVDPVSGRLACRTEGVGKMAEVDVIFRAICDLLDSDRAWEGKNVLITAGPTREPIDAVRYITNRSSGKMGYALAEEAVRQGAAVTLISGPVSLQPPADARLVSVKTAEEMRRAALDALPAADAVFAAAAVADYRPSDASVVKIKKGDADISMTLVRNPDILCEMSAARRPGQVLVGFAAETDNIEQNALAKLRSKNLDFVVANDVSSEGAGFDVDTNIATVYSADADPVHMPLMTKREMASHLLALTRPKLNN